MTSEHEGGKSALRQKPPKTIGELAGTVLDPVIEKRAGISASLIAAWEEVAGDEFASTTLPLKVQWPRRASDDDPFQPATLTLAADPSVAFVVEHEKAALIARINGFLGFAAIAAIRIRQRPVESRRRVRREPVAADPAARRRIGEAVSVIEDDGLRDALARLGESIAAERRRLSGGK